MMLRAVLDDRPYPPPQLGAGEWEAQALHLVDLRDLVSVTEGVSAAAVLMDQQPTRLDPLHVVRDVDGVLYLEPESVHRAVRALVQDRTRAWAHVLELGDR